MEKDQLDNDQLNWQWQDDFLDLDINNNPFIRQFFQYRDHDIFTSDINEKEILKPQMTSNSQKQINESIFKEQIVTSIQQEQSQLKTLKRQHLKTDLQKYTKDPKSEKQQLYSKVYRQKKKQRYRIIQEQNEYLKKRISELQNQLRQQELQLNRFKFPPPQKELTVNELNNQLIELTVNLLKELKADPKEYNRQSCRVDEDYYKSFRDSYEQRGFAGKKKIKLLNYHFNEILQSLLKDSQKYLSLVYANSQSYDKLVPLSQFTPINNAFFQVCKSEQDFHNRLKIFNKFLHPISLELNTHISQFYKKFEDILNCSNKIHNFLRDTYLNNNVDIGIRRLQMETWLDFHKYGKMMRKMRNQWFEWMKSLAQKDEKEAKIGRKVYKKKKKCSHEVYLVGQYFSIINNLLLYFSILFPNSYGQLFNQSSNNFKVNQLLSLCLIVVINFFHSFQLIKYMYLFEFKISINFFTTFKIFIKQKIIQILLQMQKHFNYYERIIDIKFEIYCFIWFDNLKILFS